MRYGYVVYAKAKPFLFDMNNEEIGIEMTKLANQAEKFGIKLHMWGFPYGVNDDLLVVYGSELGLENYMNFEIKSDLPYTETRTTIVAIPI
jgi:hypothetical protein